MLKQNYTLRGAIRWSMGTVAGIHLLNAAVRSIRHKPHSPVVNHLTGNPDISLVISKKRKFVYLKVAKTAGSSILRGVLLREVDDIITRREAPVRYLHWLQKITDEELANYYLFTIVRNPLDRLASAYQHLGRPKGLSFPDFLTLVEQDRGGVKIRAHTQMQHTHVQTNGNPFVDFIGEYENLEHDWETISKRLGVSSELPLVNVSQTPSGRCGASQFYDSETLTRAQAHYRPDFEALGYPVSRPPAGKADARAT